MTLGHFYRIFISYLIVFFFYLNKKNTKGVDLKKILIFCLFMSKFVLKNNKWRDNDCSKCR
jgi:hypothetical protein